MHLVDGGREPGGVELLGVDAGVAEAFLVGFEHQLFGAGIPAFAELGAAHAENGDLVLATTSHCRSPWGLGVQTNALTILRTSSLQVNSASSADLEVRAPTTRARPSTTSA